MNIELQIIEETISNKEIKELVEKINTKRLQKISVLPCHISAFKKNLSNKIKLSAVIDFPLGILSKEIRKTIAEKSIINGASSVEIICPSYSIVNKNYTSFKHEINDIKAMCIEKDAELSYIIEYRTYSYDCIYRICKNLLENGINNLYLSTGYRIDDIYDHLIAITMIQKKIPKINIIPNANIFNKNHKKIIEKSNINKVRLKSIEAVDLFLDNC